MQVINLSAPYDKKQIPAGPVILALGFFDGVHRGHQEVIHAAKKLAVEKNVKLAVMTFDRYPKGVYQKLAPEDIRYLTLTKRKLELFSELGADIAYVLEFNSNMTKMRPQDFVDNYIVGLNAVGAVAGFDFTYGKPDSANMSVLSDYARGRFTIHEVPELKERSQKVGSTQIKAALDQGKIQHANALLGYPFETSGIVVHGKARGRTMGFPTINVKVDQQQKLPTIGVYAVKVQIDEKWFDGMASVSHNETFGPNRKLTVEINLFDVKQDFYNKDVRVQWFQFLRSSIKFADVADLIEQKKQDETNTRKFFNDLNVSGFSVKSL